MTNPEQPVSSTAHARGIQRLWDSRVWGTVVGAVGAAVFVLTNRSALADPWPTVALVVWVFALLDYVAFVFVVPRPAFHIPMFTTLGALMAVLGVGGLVLGWAWDGRAAAAVAVLSGVAMLVVIAGDALRGAVRSGKTSRPSTNVR